MADGLGSDKGKTHFGASLQERSYNFIVVHLSYKVVRVSIALERKDSGRGEIC